MSREDVGNQGVLGMNVALGLPTGLTKREYFAGLAMQALISARNLSGGMKDYVIIARHATCCADALLDELNDNEEE